MVELEAEQADVRRQLLAPDLYTRDPQVAADLHARDASIDEELMAALEQQEALST